MPHDVCRRLARASSAGAVCALLATTAGRAETPTVLARAAATETTVFDVYFPVQQQRALDQLIAAQTRPGSAEYRKFLTPEEFKRRFGPPPSTVQAVVQQLQAAGLAVTATSALGLHVSGSIGAVERSFGAALSHARFADGSAALVAERPLTLSGALAASGARVPQFTTVPPLHKHSQVLGPVPFNFISTLGPYYAADLRQAYDFPAVTSLDGRGATIGVLMSGDFQQSDMNLYFDSELLTSPALRPVITSVLVNGGAAFDPNGSAETHLDIQQSAATAPGADVILYNMSDLNASTVIYGLTLLNEANAVDVVNMSFGGPETAYLAKQNNGTDETWLLQIQHSLFQQGNAQGITFVASSGDHGAIPEAPNCKGAKCTRKPTLTAQNPADDPDVTAVGGTNLLTVHDGTNNSAYAAENANPDALAGANAGIWGSGGGISIIFAKPSYQNLVATPSATFRTVPDLALHMGGCQASFAGFVQPCGANRSSDVMAINGTRIVVIGTSASAPDITGLFALKRKLVGSRLGNENLDIYTRAHVQPAGSSVPFRHVGIVGSNGHYTVRAPYDAVIGNGTVDARSFLGATNLPASGILGSPSNP